MNRMKQPPPIDDVAPGDTILVDDHGVQRQAVVLARYGPVVVARLIHSGRVATFAVYTRPPVISEE